MSNWTLKKALEFALKKEEDSIRLYTTAQDKVTFPSSREFLEELVRDEKRHKQKILEIMKNPNDLQKIGYSDIKIQNLKIVDYLMDVDLSSDSDYQSILIYAGKREKRAHAFYIDLATVYKHEQIGELFVRLANEELKHKFKLEKEYDDVILKFM